MLRSLAGLRSCRSFAPVAVPREMISGIIEASRWAGSARNSQPWRFVAVTGTQTCETLSRLGGYAQHLARAPAVLVVIEPRTGGRDTQFDMGRVSQNIALAAAAFGLGSCVASFYPEANAVTAASIVGCDSGWLAQHAIAIGWPVSPQIPGRSAIPVGRLSVSDLLRWCDRP